LSADPRFVDLEAMKANTTVLRGLLQDAFRDDTREHWLATLEEADFLCAPVRDLGEALGDPQTTENEMIWAEGPVRLVADPMHLSATPASLRRLPPRLGEQTDEILAGLDLSPEEIADLHAQGVVA
jgi:formyl-CoA transferase